MCVCVCVCACACACACVCVDMYIFRYTVVSTRAPVKDVDSPSRTKTAHRIKT